MNTNWTFRARKRGALVKYPGKIFSIDLFLLTRRGSQPRNDTRRRGHSASAAPTEDAAAPRVRDGGAQSDAADFIVERAEHHRADEAAQVPKS